MESRWRKDSNIQYAPTKDGFLIKLSFYKLDSLVKVRKRVNKTPTWIYRFDYDKLKNDLKIKEENVDNFKEYDSDDDMY